MARARIWHVDFVEAEGVETIFLSGTWLFLWLGSTHPRDVVVYGLSAFFPTAWTGDGCQALMTSSVAGDLNGAGRKPTPDCVLHTPPAVRSVPTPLQTLKRANTEQKPAVQRLLFGK